MIQIDAPESTGDFSPLLSNNHPTGETCFGDSNVVAGGASFGPDGTCAGTGGVFRMDRQGILDLIDDIMNR